MRRPVLALLTSLVAVVLLAGCDPAPVSVSMDDDFFSPATAAVTRGGSVRWTNDGVKTHTTTGDAPLSLWNSGNLASGATFRVTLVAAGAYTYHCTIHSFMTGTVKVPVAVNPTSGTSATTFTITVASATAPTGFEYVVQKKDPAGTFQTFKTFTSASTTFNTAAPGTYQFRASLKRTASTASSGFSDPQTVTVS